MIIDLEKLRETLQVEKDDENTGYISINELRSALAIAAARTNIEKEIDNELCREAMFECIQYFREAGHLKDLDNSYK